MAKYVPDVTTDRWVIVAEGRSKRPSDKELPKNVNKICVFCPGFEKIPGEEVYRIGNGAAYEPGWQVRVIKNKYPITDFHEVIIHSPDHEKEIDVLPASAVENIIKAYRDRFVENSSHGQVIIFNNVGDVAGASISHPHSQLVVVPKQITLDALEREPIENVIVENDQFVVYCPNFSQWPFETWIAPKAGSGQTFGELNEQLITGLSGTLQDALKRLLFHLAGQKHFHPGLPMTAFKNGPAYNFYIYPGRDWYIRIIPRLIHRAGFELGTGLSVNIIDPADAAEMLKADVDGGNSKT